MIDASINLGNIITIITVGGGIIGTFVAMRTTVTSMKGEMIDLKQEVKKLADVLISVARQEERLTAMDQRMLLQGQRIDELRMLQSRTDGARFDLLCDRFNGLITTMEARGG